MIFYFTSTNKIMAKGSTTTKTKMSENQFYDVRSRTRVTVNPDSITIKTIPATKYRDNKPRYQAVALHPSNPENKLYKFVSKDFADRYT